MVKGRHAHQAQLCQTDRQTDIHEFSHLFEACFAPQRTKYSM